MDLASAAVCGDPGIIGYGEAWGKWAKGCDLKDFTLWGERLVFWARLGKILQFVGGLVVILDLVGPKVLDKWAEDAAEVKGLSDFYFLFQGFLLLLLLPVALFFFFSTDSWSEFWGEWHSMRGVAGIFALGFALLFLTGRILRNAQNPRHPLRWMCFLVLIVGFSFDMLGS